MVDQAIKEENWKDFVDLKTNNQNYYRYYNWKLATTQFSKNIALKLCSIWTPILFQNTEMLDEWINFHNDFFNSDHDDEYTEMDKDKIVINLLEKSNLECFSILIKNCEKYDWSDINLVSFISKNEIKAKIMIESKNFLKIIKSDQICVLNVLLDFATRLKLEKEVKILLQNGANYLYQFNKQYNRTLFSKLLFEGNYDAILLMIENGFDCNKLEFDKNISCLSLAINQERMSIVKLLIEKGNAQIINIPYDIMKNTTKPISEYIYFKLGLIEVKKRKLEENIECIVKKQKIDENEFYKKCVNNHYVCFSFYDRINCGYCSANMESEIYKNE